MQIACTNCGAASAVSDAMLGGPVRCRQCQSIFSPHIQSAPSDSIRAKLDAPLPFEHAPIRMRQRDIALPASAETMGRIRRCAMQFTATGYTFAALGFVALAVGMGLIARSESFVLMVTLVPVSVMSLGAGVFMIVAGSYFQRCLKWGLVLAAALVSLTPALLVNILAMALLVRINSAARGAGLISLALFYAGVRTLFLLADPRVRDAFAFEEARRLRGE